MNGFVYGASIMDHINRREIDVWQTKNTVFLDDTEMEELHSKVQQRFNKFLAGLPARRMAEHRINLTIGQINNNYQIIEEAPGEFYKLSPDTNYHHC